MQRMDGILYNLNWLPVTLIITWVVAWVFAIRYAKRRPQEAERKDGKSISE